MYIHYCTIFYGLKFKILLFSLPVTLLRVRGWKWCQHVFIFSISNWNLVGLSIKEKNIFLNWKQIPPLNFALSFFNLKCNWTELEKKKSCYTTVFLLINARKEDQSWSFGGKYSFFFKSCFMLELFPILMETCMKKENVLKLQFR